MFDYLKKLNNFFVPQKRAKFYSNIKKSLLRPFRSRVDSIPIFILGQQRSGTSMLMYCFHQHPDTEVFDESSDNMAFKNFRLRNYYIIHNLIYKSKFPFVVFKPLIDSHLIKKILSEFPTCKCIWVYRHYLPVAKSALKRWHYTTRSIKIVVSGKTGGGWFQEGVSKKTEKILKSIAKDDFTELEWACLIWYARNRIYLENRLYEYDNIVLLKYEYLVSKPDVMFSKIFDFVGMKSHNIWRYVHSKNLNTSMKDKIRNELKEKCDELLSIFDSYALR